MDDLQEAKKWLKLVAKSQAKAERQRTKDRIEAKRQRTKDRIETKRQQDRANKERAELRAQAKRSETMIGHMNNRFGDLAEAMLVGDVVHALKEIDDLQIEQSYFNVEYHNGDRVECEIDALLVGKDSVVVMEAKSTLTTTKVDNFVNKNLSNFTRRFPDFNTKRVYGAVGYLKTTEGAVELAIARGLLVVRSTYQAKEIINPKKFKPKNYNPHH